MPIESTGAYVTRLCVGATPVGGESPRPSAAPRRLFYHLAQSAPLTVAARRGGLAESLTHIRWLLQELFIVAINIRTFMGGREIPRSKVLDWERRRALVVLKKLGGKPSGEEDLATLRRQVLDRKVALGSNGIRQLLQRELAMSQPLANFVARISSGRRRFSVTELLVDRGSASEFVDWFAKRAELNDELAMISACPDHYVIQTDVNGAQEVIETTGGAPMVGRFMIDYQDLSSLRSLMDPEYPYQAAGVAKADNGLVIGGVRHQFRNEGPGFRARLLVEFPAMILPGAVSAHRWHLASEFSNWIEAAFGSHSG